MPKKDTAQPLQTGRYDMRCIDAGHNGHFGVESEPGRSIVLSRGDYISLSDGSQQYMPKSRLMLDARDVPHLLNALSWAADNAAMPVTCPNGCRDGAACSECP